MKWSRAKFWIFVDILKASEIKMGRPKKKTCSGKPWCMVTLEHTNGKVTQDYKVLQMFLRLSFKEIIYIFLLICDTVFITIKETHLGIEDLVTEDRKSISCPFICMHCSCYIHHNSMNFLWSLKKIQTYFTILLKQKF